MPTSELAPEVHRLIDAMHDQAVAQIRTWMTPQLRGRVSLAALGSAAERLRADFGDPLGILEEHVHREGDLQWYSGLVLFGTRGGRGKLTPVLYQFAQDEQGRLARLLVREHWFIDQVDPPAEDYVPITRFHFPARGEWTVLHGGRRRATNYHHGSKSQRYAYDLVKKKNGRQRPKGSDPKDNRSWYGHGQDLLAPAAGVVVKVNNDVPENEPGQRGKGGGNGVIIDHGFGEYSALWHAIPGSVRVQVGDRVAPGQVVGKVGNSGRSTGVHIHFHASHRRGWKDEQFGLPAPLVDVFVDEQWYPRKMPVRGQVVRSSAEDRTEAVARGPRVLIDG